MESEAVREMRGDVFVREVLRTLRAEDGGAAARGIRGEGAGEEQATRRTAAGGSAMTRKQAIEAAISDKSEGEGRWVTFAALERLADEMRIAGMLEAAKIAQQVDLEWLPTGARAEIRKSANGLARKLREAK